MPTEQSPNLIRLPEVQRMTGLRRSMIYALAKRGDFPKPIRITERCVAWPEPAVRTWIAERMEAAQ